MTRPNAAQGLCIPLGAQGVHPANIPTPRDTRHCCVSVDGRSSTSCTRGISHKAAGVPLARQGPQGAQTEHLLLWNMITRSATKLCLLYLLLVFFERALVRCVRLSHERPHCACRRKITRNRSWRSPRRRHRLWHRLSSLLRHSHKLHRPLHHLLLPASPKPPVLQQALPRSSRVRPLHHLLLPASPKPPVLQQALPRSSSWLRTLRRLWWG